MIDIKQLLKYMKFRSDPKVSIAWNHYINIKKNKPLLDRYALNWVASILGVKE